MIFDAVPARHDFPAHRRVLAGVAANAEKTGPGAGRVEQIEHARRHFRMRAVVDGQRDLAALDRGSRQPIEVGAKQGRARQQSGADEYRLIDGDGADGPWPVTGQSDYTDTRRGVGGERKLEGGGRFPGSQHENQADRK